MTLIFACQPDNDLYRVLARLDHTAPRHDTLDRALEAAPQGAAILSLADTYPRPSPAFDERHASLVRAKELRLYLEYPASLPGIRLGEPRPTQWERVVVASDFFAPQLERHTILAQHGCWYLPFAAASTSLPAASPPSRGRWQPGQGDDALVEPRLRPSAPTEQPPCDLHDGMDVHLAVARVAAYDHAVSGLPDEACPILLALPGSSAILVATSALSHFVRGRYGPQRAWKAIWERLLRWLSPAEEVPKLTWTPTVRVQAGPETPLPQDVEGEALCRSVRWFHEQVVYSIDWKKGTIEGFESGIDHEGRPMRRLWARGDCTAETAMVFAHDWALSCNPDSRLLATQVLDYVWSPDFYQGDPDSPAYGMNNWYERGPVFYGDDNARVIVPTLVARHLLADERWDERVLRCLLANLRTTGRLGYRRNRIDLGSLLAQERGWAFYYDEETVSYAPHYQAYLWAAYLLAFALTGFDGFLDRTRTAIRMTMDVYPRWLWTNGLTQEMARMLLPPAFLVRIDDSAEHRSWLACVAHALLAQMQPCGAIREQLGPLESGRYGPPASNAAYGTAEAPLIQENGDPACDLLYTTNYALLGLHEAAAVTGSAALLEADDRLAQFLCCVQVRSEEHPYLDGAWMRGFDYERWEYWGSSADLGWGAWSVESGWTNTWIAAVLAMRQLDRSLLELATTRPLSAELDEMVATMLGPSQGGRYT